MDRDALVRILANCSEEDSETDLHMALVNAYAVTEDEIEQAFNQTLVKEAIEAGQ